MAKTKTKNTRQYVLVDIREMNSKLNGGTYYRLTWVCIDDMTRWEMDVQDSYRNYLRNGWRSIIDNQRWGVYEGMWETARNTNRGVNVLSADSRPECIIPIDTQDLAIEVILKEQERLNDLHARNNFDKIFVPF